MTYPLQVFSIFGTQATLDEASEMPRLMFALKGWNECNESKGLSVFGYRFRMVHEPCPFMKYIRTIFVRELVAIRVLMVDPICVRQHQKAHHPPRRTGSSGATTSHVEIA